jgi:hypothetical protein
MTGPSSLTASVGLLEDVGIFNSINLIGPYLPRYPLLYPFSSRISIRPHHYPSDADLSSSVRLTSLISITTKFNVLIISPYTGNRRCLAKAYNIILPFILAMKMVKFIYHPSWMYHPFFKIYFLEQIQVFTFYPIIFFNLLAKLYVILVHHMETK